MIVQLATLDDLEKVMCIIQDAKQYLNAQGSTQWQDKSGYPTEAVLKKDIEQRQLYMIKEGNDIACVGVLSEMDEPSYHHIEGTWHHASYMVIHRLATKATYRGLGYAKKWLEFAIDLASQRKYGSIRVDTMEQNLAMRSLLQLVHFQYCGIIYLSDHTIACRKRLAYELLL